MGASQVPNDVVPTGDTAVAPAEGAFLIQHHHHTHKVYGNLSSNEFSSDLTASM